MLRLLLEELQRLMIESESRPSKKSVIKGK